MATIAVPDFEKVGTGLTMLDPGAYTAKIEVEPKEEFDEDKSYLDLSLKVVQGPEQKEPDQNGSTNPAGRDIRDRIYMTPKAYWRLKRLLIAAGLITKDDKTSSRAKGDINLTDLVGCTLQVILTATKNPTTGREYRNVEYVI